MPIAGKTRREALTEFRQLEILGAARTVFAEHGFRDATLDQIAAAAGTAKGTLYLYFSSKEEIFASSIRSRMKEVQVAVGQAIAAATGTEAKLRAAVHTRFTLHLADRNFFKIYFTEFNNLCAHPGQFGDEFKHLYLEGARLLEPVLREGMRRGEIRRLPVLETAMALADLTRSVFAAHVLGLQENRFDLEEFVFQLFWRGIRAEGGEAGRPEGAKPEGAKKAGSRT